MISTSDARAHLRIDGTQDDREIEQKLVEAVALASSYIGTPAANVPADILDSMFTQAPDDMTEEEVAATIAADRANWQARALDAAVLLILSELWRCRESGTSDPLSPAVKRILDIFKKPVYA